MTSHINTRDAYRVLRPVTEAVSQQNSASERASAAVAALRAGIPFDAAVIYIRHHGPGESPMAYWWGISDELHQLMTDPTIDADMVHRLEVFVSATSLRSDGYVGDLRGTIYQETDGLEMAATFPLTPGNTALGILILAWKKWHRLSPEELEVCEMAASLMGVALQQDALIAARAEAAALRERARLARDIHDSVTQAVTAAVLNMEAADRELDGNTEAARHALNIAKQLARQGIADLRRAIWNLRSDLEKTRNLRSALDTVAQPLREAGIVTSTTVKGSVAKVPPDIAAAALSIAREASSNVLRHSKARSAEISLNIAAGVLTLAIVDNGLGFTGEPGEQSFGLIGMRERAQSVGGELYVGSRETGTRIEARLPLEVDDDDQH